MREPHKQEAIDNAAALFKASPDKSTYAVYYDMGADGVFTKRCSVLYIHDGRTVDKWLRDRLVEIEERKAMKAANA